MAYDPDAALGAGATAVLPTTFRRVVLNGVVFRQFWYIGRCQRPATGGACVALCAARPFTMFYRVIVGVTWPGRSCPGSVCWYVTSSLIGSQTEEPVFDTNEGSSAADDHQPARQPDRRGRRTGVAGHHGERRDGAADLVRHRAAGGPVGRPVERRDQWHADHGRHHLGGHRDGHRRVRAEGHHHLRLDGRRGARLRRRHPAGVHRSARRSPAVTLAATNGIRPYAWTATGLPAGRGARRRHRGAQRDAGHPGRPTR